MPRAGDGLPVWVDALPGAAALVTALGGVIASGRRLSRHLERCESDLADAWSVIGVLLELAPGGSLVDHPERRLADRDPAIRDRLDAARRRHRARVERARWRR